MCSAHKGDPCPSSLAQLSHMGAGHLPNWEGLCCRKTMQPREARCKYLPAIHCQSIFLICTRLGAVHSSEGPDGIMQKQPQWLVEGSSVCLFFCLFEVGRAVSPTPNSRLWPGPNHNGAQSTFLSGHGFGALPEGWQAKFSGLKVRRNGCPGEEDHNH